MTLFQIIMIALISVGFAVALGFAIAFIIEAVRGAKIVSNNQKITEDLSTKEEYDINQMLAQLEQEAQNASEQEEVAQNEAELIEEPVLEEVVQEEPVAQSVEEIVVEDYNEQLAIEEPVSEETEEIKEVVEEKVEAQEIEETEELSEKKADTDDDDEDDEDAQPAKEIETPKTIVIKEVTTETVGTDFDYNVRLAKIVESKNKMEKDLQKTKRAIMKYERTGRRRARNQKMLDRRAVELTNLNLMMYSVTDIKNVDADKKAKQEELTTHISELKASIQDADLFLAKNKEKYEHDKKMFAFYTKEEARYNDEIKELEILIKNANNITGSTTTTTTTTTETVE